MIKRKLLLPDENDDTEPPAVLENDKTDTSQSILEAPSEKSSKKKTNSTLKQSQYSAQQIHEKILNHISNLQHGRKVNLICGVSTGYDNAIEQIQKKRRLEISTMLREMCSNQSVENCEAKINSIIPDFGLKIEDIPLEVIKELSNALDMDIDSLLPLPVSDERMENSDITLIPKIKLEVVDGLNDVNVLSEIAHENELDNRLPKIENVDDQIFNSNEIKIEPTADSLICDDTLKESIATQPDKVPLQTDTATQTDNIEYELSKITNLKDAVDAMLKIDNEIEHLTKLRQSIYFRFLKEENKISKKQIIRNGNESKRKINKVKICRKTRKTQCSRYEKPLKVGNLKEKVSTIEV